MMRWADGVTLVVEPPMMSVCSLSELVFGNWGYSRIRTSVAALILPHHGWLEEPFQKDVRRDGVTFGAHASKDIRRLITLSSHMMKLESLKPS